MALPYGSTDSARNTRKTPTHDNSMASNSDFDTSGNNSRNAVMNINQQQTTVDDEIVNNLAATFDKTLNYDQDEEGNIVVQDKEHTVDVQGASILEKVRGRELFEMDAKEREAINNEAHGIENRAIQENPRFVATSLHQLRNEIDENLSCDLDDDPRFAAYSSGNRGLFSKRAHNRGLELQSEYIQSDALRIRFLRAELFDISKAAIRYFCWLDVVHTFFGDQALMRPLYQSDLTKRELSYLRQGRIQVLPSRDRMGRRVVALMGLFNTETFTTLEIFRSMTYLFDVLAQCETTQKLGFVLINILQSTGMTKFGGSNMIHHTKRWNLSLPVRLVAFHTCVPNFAFARMLFAAMFAAWEKSMRAKIFFNSGTQMENIYYLSGFGISSGDIPLTSDGKVKSRIMARFVRAREAIEIFQKEQISKMEETGDSIWTNNSNGLLNNSFVDNIVLKCPVIECPGPNCVVFGHKDMYNHPANVRVRELVIQLEEQRNLQIANCDETVSTSIAGFVDEIRHRVQSISGLRFFTYNRGLLVYEEIDKIDELNKRLLRVLRDIRKRSNRNNTDQCQGKVKERKQRKISSENLGDSSVLGLESYKRAKTNEDDSFCFGSC